MVDYREILRLHNLGYSQRVITSSVHSSRSTVKEVIDLANALKIEWPLDANVTNSDLELLLYPARAEKNSNRMPIDFPWIHRELAKKGVTMTLLWTEYCEQAYAAGKQPYMSTQFGDLYRKWAIGMVKQLKQRYSYRGKSYTLSELRKFVRFESGKNIFGSVVVTTKTGIPVKIVIVRNRNKKNECLYLLSTDCSLSDAEIVRIYGNRWSIECFFKASKSLLKLGTEFQSRSYDAIVSHTAIVFTRYTVLEWIRRNTNDQKTYGELFFMFCEDIQDMELTDALQSLMALFVEHISMLSADITACIKSKVTNWIASQAKFIQALFADITWES